MTESLKSKQENAQEHLGESYKNNHEYNHTKPYREEMKSKQMEKLDEVRKGLELISNPSAQTLDKIKEMSSPIETVSQSSKNINKDLKKAGLQKELSHIRRELGTTDRLASKIVHNKTVSVISNGLSKTVVRPSGMLGGAIIALIGTSIYYLFTKAVGVKYNYFIYILLFVGGFVLGIMIELIIRLFKKDKSLKFN